MGVYTKLADDVQEVDVIIAGGKSHRLLLADPKLSILLIEGGPNNYNMPNIVHPVFFLDHLHPTSQTTIFYKTKQHADREVIVPSGGTIGGGSSINFMMYTRAQRSDFDSWKSRGWSADELWPYLKLENYHGQGEKDHHGSDGPVHVPDSTFRARGSQDDFIGAAAQVGWPEIKDLQTLDANNGIERWQRYISKDVKRQDTAHKYLHEKLRSRDSPNLHALVESKVVRVLFDDDKRAIGVEYTPNPDLQPTLATPQQPKLTVRARNQVIVSCGACGTPPVLERSGLGDPEVLKKVGVPVVVDLPAVGRDYQDHNLSLYPYRTSLKPRETIDVVLRNPGNRQNLIDAKDDTLGWNSIGISSKLRPTEEDVAALGPEFQAAWNQDFKNAPDRPLMLMGVLLGRPIVCPEAQYVTIGNYTAYPYSRGHMYITGPELSDPLDFDVGFFSDAHDIDLKKQIWAYKKQREIMRRTSMYRGELAPGHPAFPAGSEVGCIETYTPLSNVKDLKYSPEDDAAIEKWLRENIGTTWHSLGTAKMAPREEFGVADESLNVWGTKGLKIADLSILPMNVGANTNNTAIVVGEKAAAILIQELGLQK
ncbi:alcohol oxidase [Ilyonectria robusta]|uniref:alcohol oxidase n=1 Tax=Ilyonectria robusta TaxID=1079257 RepID=UPI001E8D3B10|nr:alcohol oxidase [Ilyonectria robusta]KAH8659674.1 alcohol oxidase [Ilyonectria robusta]